MRALGASRTSLVPGGALAGGWTRNALWKTARAVPSLDLRFADNKSLVDAVTGASLVTFTRASSGTFVDSAGVLQTAAIDVPRFDHNPTTGESLGLLVEESRTNLMLRSEEFDNAIWAKDFTTATADADTAPNGTTTADKVAEDSSNNFHAISQYVSGFASGAIATLSIYAKAAGRTRFRIQTDASGGTGTADFDLSAGTATAGTGVFSNGSIINVGNGWYRCSVRCTTSGAGAIGLKVILAQTTFGVAYTGDGTSGIYLWGAQLEAGATTSSYIPTTTAAATRSADVASITGTAFSGWYNQTEGTLFAEFRPQSTATFGIAGFDDGTNDNRWRLGRASSGEAQQIVQVLGVNQVTSIISSLTLNGLAFAAATVRLNNCSITANGLIPLDDTSCTVPTVNKMTIGSAQALTTAGSTIRRLTYWPQALPSRLQAITQ